MARHSPGDRSTSRIQPSGGLSAADVARLVREAAERRARSTTEADRARLVRQAESLAANLTRSVQALEHQLMRAEADSILDAVSLGQ